MQRSYGSIQESRGILGVYRKAEELQEYVRVQRSYGSIQESRGVLGVYRSVDEF